ncbi:MAG: Mevalonate kinase [Candidatus Thermoplasmatota archaeon]|nr:Mevalonate kinase [Candidatus Thermoplasmatota archaeon]
MKRCSAPGKIILFGEHAVVFGKPAFALAIDLRITSTLSASTQYLVNGRPMKKQYHMYVSSALDQAWDGPPVEVVTRSQIPSGSGLGSSAAVTVATIAAMLAEKGRFQAEAVARKAFEVELAVQGRASPTDTSTSSNGHGVLVAQEKMDGFLWRIESGDKSWSIHHREVPEFTFVIGYTGIHASTGPLVAGVKALVDSSRDAAKAVDRIAELVMDGVNAMEKGDKAKVGRLMAENHQLLNTLGVGHAMLDRAVEACGPVSYGAKMTGAGGGGSMIALTDDPTGASKAIASTGCTPFTVKVGCEGVRLEPYARRDS